MTTSDRASATDPAEGLTPSSHSRIGNGRIWRLCQKELRETLRDRRTIVTLVLMPLLVYPLLSMALNRYLLSSGVADDGFTVGVRTEEEGAQLDEWLSDPRSLPPKPILEASGNELAEFRLVITGNDPPESALENNQIDVGAEILFGASGRPRQVTVLAFRGDAASESARRILVERLQWLELAKAKAAARRFSRNRYLNLSLRVEVEDVGNVDSTSLLATVVPLVLVLMTITGAVYPAIDLTAGERERGTMEPLMASPVPRSALLLAKYVAVVSVALLTAVANLLAMFVTLWASRLLEQLTGGGSGFPWIAIVQILALLVLFSSFFSAVLLCLTSFAKSFKEAQAYLIPVMLLSLAPAMLSLMPGVELSGPLAIAPLINIVLLARDVLASSVVPAAALAAVLSTTAYAVAALGLAAKLFGADAVTRTSEDSIGSLFRRPEKPSLVPTPQAAALMLALLVPIYFVVSNTLMRFVTAQGDAVNLTAVYVLNAASLAATFGLVPLLAAAAARNQYHTTFRLHAASLGSFLGAVVVGLGMWAIAHEALVTAYQFGVGEFSEEKIRRTAELLGDWKELPTWLLLGTLALAPAVIEELCFRGYLFSSLLKVLSPSRTILLTALLFGLFHVLTGSSLLVERFIPTTIVGLMLGWIAWRTGSVFPGMVMHFLHNALIQLVGKYHDRLGLAMEVGHEPRHLPVDWTAGAAIAAAVGVAIVWLSNRNRDAIKKA